ncbi:hypothetical protein JMJ35_002131 [Cladonia borealis]|uniref:Uncharacterized protein n=1 Tax=Cladonia borealis TaxID=184061 RepID=A0AA39R707_9LECA|nr:hypothetical protein JMJ35_002131 [Cladonia borealis]
MLVNSTILNATALLLNQPSYHRSVDQQAWLRDQYQAMGLEADYAVQKLSKFKNVQTDCLRFMNFILVKIRFPSDGNAEYIEDSLIATNLALRYRIEGPPDSVLSKKVDKYVTRTGKVTNFTGAIVDFDMHADCVIQLRLLQEIPTERLANFHNQLQNQYSSIGR